MQFILQLPTAVTINKGNPINQSYILSVPQCSHPSYVNMHCDIIFLALFTPWGHRFKCRYAPKFVKNSVIEA